MLARKEGKGTGTGRSLHSEGKGNGWSQWLVDVGSSSGSGGDVIFPSSLNKSVILRFTKEFTPMRAKSPISIKVFHSFT